MYSAAIRDRSPAQDSMLESIYQNSRFRISFVKNPVSTSMVPLPTPMPLPIPLIPISVFTFCACAQVESAKLCNKSASAPVSTPFMFEDLEVLLAGELLLVLVLGEKNVRDCQLGVDVWVCPGSGCWVVDVLGIDDTEREC